MSTLTDDAVLAVMTKHFKVKWHLHYNGRNRHEAVQAIGPANLHVELDGSWMASLAGCGDDGVAWAYPGGAMAEPEELRRQGIEAGSLEELDAVLKALVFNAGQAIEEMVRGYLAATGRAHDYVEPTRAA